MKLTTTLNRIKDHNPCNSKDGDPREWGWNKLIDFLGHDYQLDKEIDLLTILELNGVKDFAWALRATIQDPEEISRRISIAAAEYVLPIFEEKYPNDTRPREAIEAGKKSIDAYSIAYSAAYSVYVHATPAPAYAAYTAAAAAYIRAAPYAAIETTVAAINAAQYPELTLNGLTEIIKNILKEEDET